MKIQFEMPKIEITMFNTENVVTSSGIAKAKDALAGAGVTSESVTTIDVMLAFNK